MKPFSVPQKFTEQTNERNVNFYNKCISLDTYKMLMSNYNEEQWKLTFIMPCPTYWPISKNRR